MPIASSHPPSESKPEPYYPHHDGWLPLPPEELPRPTYWPAVLAVGIMLILWGLIGSVILTVAGAVLFVIAAAGWTKELCCGTRHVGE
jgi:hypothetical protein